MMERQEDRIQVRLFATLREGREKAVYIPYQDGMTPGEILEELLIPEEEVAILLINGRTGKMDQPLQPADYLSVFPPVGGG